MVDNPSSVPDVIQNRRGHLGRAVDLQEMPCPIDDSDRRTGGQRVQQLLGVADLHRAVVGTVQVQDRRARQLPQIPVELGVRRTDAARANEIATLFTNVGLPLVVKDLSAIPGAADKTRPNSFELWFGSAPLPASCG